MKLQTLGRKPSVLLACGALALGGGLTARVVAADAARVDRQGMVLTHRMHVNMRLHRVQANQEPLLTDVPAVTLQADQNMTLEAPGLVTAISKQSAESLATSSILAQGTTAREGVLALVHSTAAVLDHHVCWVVSIMPPGGTVLTGDGARQIKYELLFVDAQTGKVLLHVGAEGPVK